jgi:hypothetical protein
MPLPSKEPLSKPVSETLLVLHRQAVTPNTRNVSSPRRTNFSTAEFSSCSGQSLTPRGILK